MTERNYPKINEFAQLVPNAESWTGGVKLSKWIVLNAVELLGEIGELLSLADRRTTDNTTEVKVTPDNSIDPDEIARYIASKREQV